MPKPKKRIPIVPPPNKTRAEQKPEEATKNVNPQHYARKNVTKSSKISGFKADVGGGVVGSTRTRYGEDNFNGKPPSLTQRPKRPNVAAQSKHKRVARQPARGVDGQWRPISVVHQQAATAVQRLLEAASSHKHGASLKSLTLAPHVVAKKATYAVTCQVLKFSQLLEKLDAEAKVSASQPKLGKYVTMVLLYELLRGEGLTRKGQAERAVLAAEASLRALVERWQQEAGVQTLDELLERQQAEEAGTGSGGGPSVPHPRWVRVNTLKAGVDDVARHLDEHLLTSRHADRPSGREMPSGASRDLRDAPSSKKRRLQELTDKAAGEQSSQRRELKQRQKEQGVHPAASHGRPSNLDMDQRPAMGQGQEPQYGMGQGQHSCCVVRDPLLPDLLALPPGTDLHDHPLVARGSVVLQSKASCMPAHALSPEPGWTVVDCCAAPGNKTTHLAAIMGNRGRVIAFDKDPRRLARLKANVALTGASCVEARLADFLSIDPTAPEFAEVRGVLLDPSCSGSGTTFTRMDHLLPSHTRHVPTADVATDGVDSGLVSGLDPEEVARVAQLARFQATALSHALRFPSLQRLVYSTCSVHVAENEAVVAGALEEAEAAGMELVDPFPSWHRRGLPIFPGAEKLVRTDAYQDGTDGFFVAVFQRRVVQQPQENQLADNAATATVGPSTDMGHSGDADVEHGRKDLAVAAEGSGKRSKQKNTKRHRKGAALAD